MDILLECDVAVPRHPVALIPKALLVTHLPQTHVVRRGMTVAGASVRPVHASMRVRPHVTRRIHIFDPVGRISRCLGSERHHDFCPSAYSVDKRHVFIRPVHLPPRDGEVATAASETTVDLASAVVADRLLPVVEISDFPAREADDADARLLRFLAPQTERAGCWSCSRLPWALFSNRWLTPISRAVDRPLGLPGFHIDDGPHRRSVNDVGRGGCLRAGPDGESRWGDDRSCQASRCDERKASHRGMNSHENPL